MKELKRVREPGDWELVLVKEANGYAFRAEHIFSGHVVGRGWTRGTKKDGIEEARSALNAWKKYHGET